MTKDEIETISENTGEHLSLKIFGEGLCKKENLLDYFENFVLYHKNKVKIIAKNHQFLGVNNAIVALQHKEENKGKLGVFWHTQGSGKSYSMIFFSKKVHRKVSGNWSFLIITDRRDLDSQIYRNFCQEGSDKDEEKAFENVGLALLEKLYDANNKILIQEWHKEKASQEKVKREIQVVLGEYLPVESYDRMIFSQKVDVAFQYFYELAQMGTG